MKRVIFDTNILMGTENYSEMVLKLQADELFIGFESLSELDNLKSKDGRKGYQARRAIRKISGDLEAFQFVMCDQEEKHSKVDTKIIHYALDNGLVLVTNDIAMKLQAIALGCETESYYEVKDVGFGYTEVECCSYDSCLRPKDFFSDLDPKTEQGEYVIFSEYGNVSSIYVKGESGFEKVKGDLTITPGHSESIQPLDEYQACAFDALRESELTVLTGRAGTGKTLLSISIMLEELNSGNIGKIVIFTNPTKARGAEELGFYKGDRNAKLLQNSIGAILISKLGSIIELERMLEEETLVIMPMSDIRGYEVPEDAYLYVSEAQNASVDLLQLAIQRASGGPIILEGDPFTQLDHWSYGGENNGMLRAIEVFKGFPGFAHVHLPNIYRSPIAEQAALMTENL